jgi:hypothetical protein
VVHPRVDGDVRQREDGHEDEVSRDDLGRRRRGRGEEAAEPDERVSRTALSTAVAGALGPAVTVY